MSAYSTLLGNVKDTFMEMLLSNFSLLVRLVDFCLFTLLDLFPFPLTVWLHTHSLPVSCFPIIFNLISSNTNHNHY